MKKIVISLSIIAGVAAIVVGATTAFFSDTETSVGNTFTAGAIDLTVDSTQHYNNAVCVGNQWQLEPSTSATVPQYPVIGSACDGTWTAADLGTQKFFKFDDVKPGDSGENTISLHVNNNDAWVRLVIKDVTNNGNGLTEPEDIVDTDADGAGEGELRQNLKFSMWLDQGAIPGFQNDSSDLTEGDNIQNGQYEPTIISEGTIDEDGEEWELQDFNGLYLPGGKTAYFGVKWNLPLTTGNEVQTDSMSATMEFQVQQVRNNPSPAW